jgi:polyferredoxin
VLCLECAKACPHANVGLGLVDAGAASRAAAPLGPVEAAFVAIAAGFVTHELAGEVPRVERLFHVVPEALGTSAVAFGWVEAAWFLGLFPAALWLAVAGAARLLGHRGGVAAAVLAAATAVAPVLAVAHLAKAVAKVSSWVGFLPLALRDPRGLETLAALRAGAPAPGPLLPLPAIGATLGVAVLLLAARAWRAPVASDAPPRRAGLALVGSLLGGVLAVWAAG